MTAEPIPGRPLGHDFDDYDTPAGELLEILLQRPAWHADGLCREHPEVGFLPGSRLRHARRLSHLCQLPGPVAVPRRCVRL